MVSSIQYTAAIATRVRKRIRLRKKRRRVSAAAVGESAIGQRNTYSAEATLNRYVLGPYTPCLVAIPIYEEAMGYCCFGA